MLMLNEEFSVWMMIGEDSFVDDLVTVVGSETILKFYNWNCKIEVDSEKTEAGFEIRKVKNPRNLSKGIKNRSIWHWTGQKECAEPV